jgi:hypothetical protein
MKTTLIFLCALFPMLFSLAAEDLRNTQVSQLIESALPEYSIVAGNKNWSGGFFGNTFNATIDFNTSFTVIKPQSDKVKSMEEITKSIRDYMASTFGFPKTEPSSSWSKDIPDGLSRDSFSEVFLLSRYPLNKETDSTLSLSVQAVRLNSTEIGITISYTTFAK